MKSPFVLALALALGASAHAQSTPAKKALAEQIVQAQQPGIDQLARQLVEQPAVRMLQGAGRAVQQQVPPEQQEAMARALQDDVRRFVDDTVPYVRDRAAALAPQTLVPLLENRLTETELKDVLAIFNSPAWRKFQGLAPELQQALGERLVTEVRPEMEKRIQALDGTMSRRLGLTPPAGAASAPR